MPAQIWEHTEDEVIDIQRWNVKVYLKEIFPCDWKQFWNEVNWLKVITAAFVNYAKGIIIPLSLPLPWITEK